VFGARDELGIGHEIAPLLAGIAVARASTRYRRLQVVGTHAGEDEAPAEPRLERLGRNLALAPETS
jgi:hypothetical protein